MGRAFRVQGRRARKRDAHDVDPDVLLNELRRGIKDAKYDTLDRFGRPIVSPDRSRCHKRDIDKASDNLDKLAKRVACPPETLKGLRCEDFNTYSKPCTSVHSAAQQGGATDLHERTQEEALTGPKTAISAPNRRGRDSNPRWGCIPPRRFSKPLP